jgi:hypothetical protein
MRLVVILMTLHKIVATMTIRQSNLQLIVIHSDNGCFYIGTTAKMWSPGGYDFSRSITDFVTLIISHAIFFVNCVILILLLECLGPKDALSSVGFKTLSR